MPTSLDEIAPANRDTICARYKGGVPSDLLPSEGDSPGEDYFIDGKAELRSAGRNTHSGRASAGISAEQRRTTAHPSRSIDPFSCGDARKRGCIGHVPIWLILSVVICLSQRLSHACLSTYFYIVKPVNGSLNQLWFLRSYNPTWITVVILELIHVHDPKLRPFGKECVN